MKQFLPVLLFLLFARSLAAQSDGIVVADKRTSDSQLKKKDTPGSHSPWLLYSYSLGYYHQRFHGLEAGIHFTGYATFLPDMGEIGLFMGTDLSFHDHSSFLSPKIGLELVQLPYKLKGWGFSERVFAGFYTTPGPTVFFLASEIGIHYFTFLELYYQYTFTSRASFMDTPNRFGLRITLGYWRTPVNVMKITW